MSLDATRPVKKYKTMKETGRLLREEQDRILGVCRALDFSDVPNKTITQSNDEKGLIA